MVEIYQVFAFSVLFMLQQCMVNERETHNFLYGAKTDLELTPRNAMHNFDEIFTILFVEGVIF